MSLLTVYPVLTACLCIGYHYKLADERAANEALAQELRDYVPAVEAAQVAYEHGLIKWDANTQRFYWPCHPESLRQLAKLPPFTPTNAEPTP